MIGLDTAALIDLYRGDESLKEALVLANEDLSTTIMNYQEIFFGIDQTIDKYSGEIDFYDTLFSDMNILSFNIFSSKKASQIFWNLKKKGNDVGRFDSIIAGIFIANGVNKIVTKNVKHFNRIPGIEVVGY